MSKSLSSHGYNREEAYFYEREQKLITKVRRIERKRKEYQKSSPEPFKQSEKKAA